MEYAKNILAFLSKSWLWLVIVAALLIFSFKGCYNPPSHLADKKAVDSVDAAWVIEKQDIIQRDDSLTNVDRRKDKQIDGLLKEQLASATNLLHGGQLIDNTIMHGQEFRIRHDTVMIIANCDSLIEEVKGQLANEWDYSKIVDSVDKVYEQRLVVKDSLVANWKSAFLHADTTIAFQKSKYNGLYLDYVKTSSRLKFNQIASKGLAGVIAVLVIKGLIKK